MKNDRGLWGPAGHAANRYNRNMNAICLLIDRLHVGYVGAYGNTWIETPSLDRLAAESFLAEQFLIDSPQLNPLYRAYWSGQHALASAGEPGITLPRVLARQGIQSALMSDEPSVLRHTLASDFSQVLPLDPVRSVAIAEDIESTHLARCFTQLIDWLEGAREPFCLWAHLGSLGTIWDAPLDFRSRYADDEDPEPPRAATVPSRMLDRDYDPDELLGYSQAYAGQVSLLDVCLGALLEYLDGSPPREPTVLMLASARGFPLGEHRRVGDCDEALYNELVHVPLLLRLPGGRGAGARTQALVHPADLFATLCDAFDLPAVALPWAARSLMPMADEEAPWPRDRLCLINSRGDRAVRTPAWHFRDGEPPELFASPDDRWHFNDVADRCRDLIDPLRAAHDQFRQAIESGDPAAMPPLDEPLLTRDD